MYEMGSNRADLVFNYCQVFFDHFFKLFPANRNLTFCGMPAAKFKILNYIVLHIQHCDQCNFFSFTFGRGLIHECDCVITFDKPLARKEGYMIKIIIT